MTSASHVYFEDANIPPQIRHRAETDDARLAEFFGPARTPEAWAREELLLEGLLSVDKTVVDPRALAKTMLGAYGSLSRLLGSPVEDVARLPGVSASTASTVAASYGALVGCMFDRIKERPALDYDALVAMALWTIGQSAVERVLVFYLDGRTRVTGMETLCSGSESFVSVSVRSVIAAACRKGAYSLLIAHNHPAGTLSPSRQDLDFVENLLKAAALVEMTLIDSLIVSSGSWYSFRESGHL